MSQFYVRKIAVLGAGVMGAQIAAHCVNAKVPVLLFDLADNKGPDKNGIVRRAMDNLKKLKPAPFGRNEDARYLEAANYDEHLERLSECDLIIEAIAERMDWKLDLYNRVGPYIRHDAIFATNTSGLSISRLGESVPEVLRAQFCGVHFFNPPRYMHLVELIPTSDTRPDVLNNLEAFLTTTLGKGVVRAKDTPNFIANRIGVFGMLATMIEAQANGLAYDVVDDLTGTRLGRAKSATFRTADVVGLDTLMHVVRTMQDYLGPQDDPFCAHFATPPVVKSLIEQGALGQKTGAGFYRKQGKTIQVLDMATAAYVDSQGKADELILRILKKPIGERLALLRQTDHPQARFLWAIYRDAFHYAAVHLQAVADTARDLDFALRWGFGWDSGPFEIWQEAGWGQVAQWVKEDIDAGKALCDAPLPAWVFAGPVAQRGGVHVPEGSWNPARGCFEARLNLPVYQRQIYRATLKGETTVMPASAGITLFEDAACRIWRQDDGVFDKVLIFSIKTKMHTMGPQVVQGLLKALDLAEAGFQSLVVWSNDEPFSAGADLQALMPVLMSEGVKGIAALEKGMQDAFLRIKYAQVPVVAAVSGLALGGGCELMLHCAKRVAYLESYIGLVEVGVGLIPGAGGLKEGAVRAARAAAASGATDLLPFLKNWFENAAMAKVSTSAIEAQSMGYLSEDDVVVFHRQELLWTALTVAQQMAVLGYRAPRQVVQIPVAGRSACATIRSTLVNMREGGFISAHDEHLAHCIADVLCGGDLEAGTLVDEQWFLDQERRHFAQLVSHPKSQERMMSLLQNGKPVRN